VNGTLTCYLDWIVPGFDAYSSLLGRSSLFEDHDFWLGALVVDVFMAKGFRHLAGLSGENSDVPLGAVRFVAWWFSFCGCVELASSSCPDSTWPRSEES